MEPLEISLTVENPQARRDFLRDSLPPILENLESGQEPLWGEMSPVEMLTHLVYLFRISRGRIEVKCHSPAEKLPRLRRFLSLNRPMPRNFENPVEADEVPRLELGELKEARETLLEEIELFFDYYRKNPGASHTNPVFGELDREGWEKLHYKHCIHHLEQFGLVQAR